MSLQKRTLSLLLTVIMVIGMLPLSAMAAESDVEDITRYAVLILDTSGSMSGTPCTVQKQAAIKFCESMLSASGENHIAIVRLNTTSSVGLDFSDDLDDLTRYINSIPASGGTNINEALTVSDNLLASIPEGAVKNIILCSDGLPESGSRSYDGPYTSNDGSDYTYANAVYNTATLLKEKYNIYTLGFFHSLSGSELAFGKKLMNDSQNAGYYEVTNPDDLEFTFGEIADDIVNPTIEAMLRKLYVDQHIAYYNTSFKDEVLEISIPDENGQTHENTNYILGNLVYDAATDASSLRYLVSKIVIDSFNLDFDYLDKTVSNYDIILADIVTSSYYEDVVTEAFNTAYMDNTSTFLGAAIDYASGKGADQLAKAAGVTMEEFREDWQAVAQTLDRMNICDDPVEYASLYGECSVIVDKYVKLNQWTDFLKFLKSWKGKVAVSAISGTVDEAFSTISDVITYCSCYDAYYAATDTFKQVLVMIYFYANSYVTIGSLDQRYFCASLMSSIENFLENSAEAETSTPQIAKQLVRSGLENAPGSYGRAAFDLFVGILGDNIPIVAVMDTIRKVAKVGLVVVDCLTNIDDRTYSAYMLYQMYFLTNCVESAASRFGSVLKTEADGTKQFELACLFDESVRIWRCCSLMLCDFGIEFETYCLQAAQKNMNSWNPITANEAIKDASWRSTAISMAALEKSLISDVHCHDVNLSYDPTTGVIDYHKNAKVITIACPVTVRVSDENGGQIALLSDNSQAVKREYEPYFHLLETEHGVQDDYMKICFIPETWNVSFTGTGTGSMNVIRADVVDGKMQNIVSSLEIPIYEGIEGHISKTTDKNVVVIDSEPEPPAPEHTHSWATAWSNDATHHWHECNVAGCPITSNSEKDGYVAHTSDSGKVTTAATAYQNGVRTYSCIVCRYVIRTESIPATGYSSSGGGGGGGRGGAITHTITVNPVRNGSVKARPSTAAKGEKVTITATPNDGYVLGTLTVKDANGQEITLTKVDDTMYTFVMSDTKVTIDATCKASDETPTTPSSGETPTTALFNSFSDVASGAYYYDAVQWAVSKEIASGYSDGTFRPNATCTRAQIVTFLWRANGSPEPSSTNTFSDVSADSYYAKAVQWALEQGITTGATETSFNPNGGCTRAQAMTFLWRANGSPATSGGSFSDVASGSYYTGAVAWAAANGVSTGYSDGTFAPNSICTRGNIITFLYRDMVG